MLGVLFSGYPGLAESPRTPSVFSQIDFGAYTPLLMLAPKELCDLCRLCAFCATF